LLAQNSGNGTNSPVCTMSHAGRWLKIILVTLSGACVKTGNTAL
jgi:hypothetical protein